MSQRSWFAVPVANRIEYVRSSTLRWRGPGPDRRAKVEISSTLPEKVEIQKAVKRVRDRVRCVGDGQIDD